MKKLSFFLTLLLGAAVLQAAPIDYLASTQSTPLKDISTIDVPAAVNGPRRAHKTYVTPEGTPLDYTMKFTQGSQVYPDRPVKVSSSTTMSRATNRHSTASMPVATTWPKK